MLGADSAQDALAICLDTLGRVELGEIARLLGRDAADARRSSASSSTATPPPRGSSPPPSTCPVTSASSSTARTRSRAGPALAVNVTALEPVLPPDLDAEDIAPRLGAVWIDADTHAVFLAEILEDPTIRVEHPGGALWAVRATLHAAATSEWGTSRVPAPALAKAVSSNACPGHRRARRRPPRAERDRDRRRAGEGRRDAGALWRMGAGRTPTAPAAAGEYNRRFNSIVLRDYTAKASGSRCPAWRAPSRREPHQRAAVARMIAEPAVGLFHQVGAGKTAEMVIGTMRAAAPGHGRKPASWCPTTCSSSSRASGCRSTRRRGSSPPPRGSRREKRRRVRRARGEQRLGRGHPHPLRV